MFNHWAPYLSGVVAIFTSEAQHVKTGKKVGDHLNKFAHLWMRNPRSIEVCQHSAKNQEQFRSMHKLFFISLPHLFSRIVPACVHSQVCFTLYQQTLKKQMVWLLLVACYRVDDNMWWDPWGSFTKGQVQTEQIDGSRRDACKPASEKDSSVSKNTEFAQYEEIWWSCVATKPVNVSKLNHSSK